MQQKYLLFLLGFEVTIRDRRTGETEERFIVTPCPDECPDDLADADKVIRNYYGCMGYDVMEIKYQESKVKEMDLKAEYDAAPTTAQYAE